MKLHEYLLSEGALTISQLRERIGIKSDIQIRQWRHGYADRQPSPEYATAIEQATNGLVMRWDLRPNDWHRIWPELIGAEGAPPITAIEPHAPSSLKPEGEHAAAQAEPSLTQPEVDKLIEIIKRTCPREGPSSKTERS